MPANGRRDLIRRLKFNDNLTCICPRIFVIWEEENLLDATQCFIELVICSTCFGHVYAHHQELATILLVWHVAYNSVKLEMVKLVFSRLSHTSQNMYDATEHKFNISIFTELHATCHASSMVASS